MNILTWNINSIRLRAHLLIDIEKLYNPDVILLQETKVVDELFPIDTIEKIGYQYMVFQGEKSYNGVAILSKKPIKKSFSLRFYNDDKRHIAALIDDLEIHNFYVPAGGDVPDVDLNPKFKHKLEFIKEAKRWLSDNENYTSCNRVIAGDFNIAPLEQDVWSSKSLKNVVSHTDVERKLLLELISELNLTDTIRENKGINDKIYSWWSYRNRDWKKSNRGRRLDHIFVSNNLKPRISKVKIFPEVRDFEKPSDHVPVSISI